MMNERTHMRQHIAEARFRMKQEACLEALDIVDTLYAKAFGLLGEHQDTGRAESFRARRCHNKLALACDSDEVIKCFCRAVGLDGPFSADTIVDLRAAIRRELFGQEPIDLNRDRSWILTLNPPDFELPDELRKKLSA